MKFSKILYAAPLLLTLSTGCSDIDESERFIPIEIVKASRNVLIEDFTGQNCINCPAAHEVLDGMVSFYEGAVIPVSIHAGNFGVKVERTVYPDYVGLMQPEGTGMAEAYGITSYPSGVVDRQGGPLMAQEWGNAVRARIGMEAGAGLTLFTALSPDLTKIDISLVVEPYVTTAAKVHVWVLESGIVAFQRNTETRLPDYVHNNVYRMSVTPQEGAAVQLKELEEVTLDYTAAVRNTDTERWNTANLTVVAFVEDASGVLQAISCDVM